MGNLYYLLFVLPLYLISKVECQCSSCTDLTYLSCNICYDNCTTQQPKQFQKCSYTYCTAYFADSNNTRTCTHYETVQLPEQECFVKCCQSSASVFTVDQLNKCIDKNKQIMTTSIIVSIVVGVVFFVVIFVCCLCFRRRGWSCCNRECWRGFIEGLCYILRCRCCFSNPIPIRRYPYSSHASYSSSRSTEQLLTEYLKWQQSQHINSQLADQNSNCPVCLINGVNTETICKHSYHLECIMEWYGRKPLCPLCKRNNVQNVRYYCRGCFVQYVNINLLMHRDVGKIMEEIKGHNCPKCQ